MASKPGRSAKLNSNAPLQAIVDLAQNWEPMGYVERADALCELTKFKMVETISGEISEARGGHYPLVSVDCGDERGAETSREQRIESNAVGISYEEEESGQTNTGEA